MKIPKHAKKVFKGEIFEVHQWKQKLFDGSYATFEALKRPNTIQVIAVQDDKVLVGYEKQPLKGMFYSFFGGRQEKGELPLLTAKRELLEETGMASEDWELFKIYNPVSKIDWSVYIFIARNCRKAAKPSLEPGERIIVKKFSFNDFISLVCSDKFVSTDIACYFLRIKNDSKKLKAFKNKLFGKQNKHFENV